MAKTAEVGPTPAVTRQQKKEKGVKKNKKRTETYSIYTAKLLKKLHPDLEISKESMCVMNLFIEDLFDRLMDEAGKIGRGSSKGTFDANAVKALVRLVFPGELGQRAVLASAKAITMSEGSATTGEVAA